jgi:Tol biopolymer transport system component
MVNPSEVEAQLQRILASPTFVGSPRSAEFLSFCVFRGSTGKVVDLKETTIAVEVFKRPPDYDPKSDPIVRVHARRVRDKLDQYYQTLGNEDPIRIDLPKGGYVPRFSRTLPHRKTDFSDWRQHQVDPEHPPAPRGVLGGLPNRPRLSTVLWTLLGLLSIAVFAMVRASANRQEAPAATTGVALPLGVTGHVSNPAWSPDGVHLAYTLTEPSGRSHVYVDVPGSPAAPERVTHEDAVEMKPAWSPDGKNLAFLRRIDLSSFRIVNLRLKDGSTQSYGPFRTIAYVMQEHGALDWSADGKFLLTTEQISPSSPLRLVLVSIATGDRTALTAPPTGSTGDIDGKFSPDGKWVAFRRGGLGDLYVVSIKGEQDRAATQLTYTMRGVRGIAWSPDSQSIFFGTHDDSVDRMGIWRIPRTGGTPQQITPVDLDAVDPSISRNGKFVFTARSLVTTLMLRSLAASTPDRPVFPAVAIDETPAISPNGRLIAFASNRSGTEQLWIGKTTEASPRQVTHFSAQGHVFFPAWSPDNRLVAFSVRNGAATNIFLYDLDRDTLQQVTATRNRDIAAVFSADGKYLYYSSNDDGTSRLWRTRTDGSERPEPMFWEATTGYVPSSDGKWMYFIEAGKTLSLIRRNLQDGSSETVFQTKGSPSFSNDLAVAGGYVYMAVSMDDDTRSDLLQINPATGVSKVVAHLAGIPSAEISGFSVSSDGHLLVTAQMTLNDSTLYSQKLK